MVRAVQGGWNGYEEDGDEESPSFSGNRDGRTITRHLIVPEEDPLIPSFANIDRLITECLPLYRFPGRYPTLTGDSLFFVDDLKVAPKSRSNGVVGDVASRTSWKATVTYKALPYPIPADPANPQPLDYLEHNIIGGSEYMTLPGTSMYWEGSETPLLDDTVSSGMLISFVQHQITRHHVAPAAIPYAYMRGICGNVNVSAFAADHPFFPSAPAESVLFENYAISRRFTSDGKFDYRVTLNYKERVGTYNTDSTAATPTASSLIKLTWNHLWDRSADPPTFKKVFADKKPSSGNQKQPMFPANDITTVFGRFV